MYRNHEHEDSDYTDHYETGDYYNSIFANQDFVKPKNEIEDNSKRTNLFNTFERNFTETNAPDQYYDKDSQNNVNSDSNLLIHNYKKQQKNNPNLQSKGIENKKPKTGSHFGKSLANEKNKRSLINNYNVSRCPLFSKNGKKTTDKNNYDSKKVSDKASSNYESKKVSEKGSYNYDSRNVQDKANYDSKKSDKVNSKLRMIRDITKVSSLHTENDLSRNIQKNKFLKSRSVKNDKSRDSTKFNVSQKNHHEENLKLDFSRLAGISTILNSKRTSEQLSKEIGSKEEIFAIKHEFYDTFFDKNSQYHPEFCFEMYNK